MTSGTLDDFEPEVVTALLGPGVQDARIQQGLLDEPKRWPEDLGQETFLYRELARLLAERGGTVEAAKSIRADLQDGAIRTVVIAENGTAHPIEPQRWRGEGSRLLYWTATASGHHRVIPYRGPIYVVTAPIASTAPPAKEREAQATTPLPDLSTKERTTALKLILGMAMGGYAYNPKRRGPAVSDILSDLERRGLAVSEQTIRDWLNEALEEVYTPPEA
jgi:hypothetical protein